MLARQWCEKAAEQNSPDAFALQGSWYLSGTVYGVKDTVKATELYRRAANLGHSQACENVAILLERDGSAEGRTNIYNPHWMEIIHFSTRAYELGLFTEERAVVKLNLHYSIYLAQFGDQEQVRWIKFCRSYPTTAATMTKLLKRKSGRFTWFDPDKIAPPLPEKFIYP